MQYDIIKSQMRLFFYFRWHGQRAKQPHLYGYLATAVRVNPPLLAALEDGCTLITVGLLAVQKMEKSLFSYAERECGAKYMGKLDILTKEYMKQPSVFADVFNQFLYHGRQVIASGNLVELDTTEISVSYGADSASVPEQRYRNVSKMLASMTDGTVAYCILAVENIETWSGVQLKS